MGDSGLESLFGIAALSGILAHQLFFKRFEVDRQPVLIFVLFFSAPFAVAYVSEIIAGPAGFSLVVGWELVGVFVLGIWGSMMVYRGWMHPLHDFDGPFWARFSKGWALGMATKTKLKWYQVDSALHSQYGDYVRTGPRELSICDARAIPSILGFKAKCEKGPFYDSMEQSVSSTRDEVWHKERRKVWDSAMKMLLTNYSPQLEAFTDMLLKRVDSSLGKPIVLNELAIHYSYDVMTQLAFGLPGGFLDHSAGDCANNVLEGIQSGIDAIGLLSQVPWLLNICTTFAGLGGPLKIFNDWSQSALEKRQERGMREEDLMEQLLLNTKQDRKGMRLLFSESRAIIGAGSDTTATALTEIFVLLAAYPRYIDKIREEIDPHLRTGTFSCQTAYPVLDSFINETMRLYPPVLFGSQRVTPPQGLQIGDRYIPGDMVVYLPTYQLHRDPRNFVEPHAFIPERWTCRGDMVLNRAAFLPFLIGSSHCPGKALAMMELRSVVARTLDAFEVGFSDGVQFDQEVFFRGVKDHFVAGVPKIEVVFAKRSV